MPPICSYAIFLYMLVEEYSSGSGFCGDRGLGEVGWKKERTEEEATGEVEDGSVEDGAGRRLGCCGGVGGKGSLYGDQGQG